MQNIYVSDIIYHQKAKIGLLILIAHTTNDIHMPSHTFGDRQLTGSPIWYTLKYSNHFFTMPNFYTSA